MKKFRMMLPMLAFVFAVGGAVAGDFFGPVDAYYRLTSTSCSTVQSTEQTNCQLNAPENYPLCTIKVGINHPQAFANDDCSGILRNVQE